jgi:hypothetical protein
MPKGSSDVDWYGAAPLKFHRRRRAVDQKAIAALTAAV